MGKKKLFMLSSHGVFKDDKTVYIDDGPVPGNQRGVSGDRWH